MSDPISAPASAVRPPAPADTPPDTPVVQPPGRLDRAKGFIGDLARPFSIYAVAVATAAAIMGPASSDKIGAAGLILAALYGAKTIEKRAETQANAQVAIAQAQSGTAA